MAEYLGLSHQIFVSFLIELVMILATLVLLDVPNLAIRFRSPGAQAAVRGAGMVMLCLTFCWSVILGCVLALNAGTYRL